MIKQSSGKNIESSCYVNFQSRIPRNLENDSWDYEDPATGKKMTVSSMLPKMEELETQAAIELMDELQYHLERALPAQRPTGQNSVLEYLWNERCRQTQELIAKVRKSMQCRVCDVYYQNRPEAEDGMLECAPGMGLKKPEEVILYRYSEGHFPGDREDYDLMRVDWALEDQYEQLQEQLEEIRSNEAAMESENTANFLMYRCEQMDCYTREVMELLNAHEEDDDDMWVENPNLEHSH